MSRHVEHLFHHSLLHGGNLLVRVFSDLASASHEVHRAVHGAWRVVSRLADDFGLVLAGCDVVDVLEVVVLPRTHILEYLGRTSVRSFVLLHGPGH